MEVTVVVGGAGELAAIRSTSFTVQGDQGFGGRDSDNRAGAVFRQWVGRTVSGTGFLEGRESHAKEYLFARPAGSSPVW